jgi:hypothetical protein
MNAVPLTRADVATWERYGRNILDWVQAAPAGDENTEPRPRRSPNGEAIPMSKKLTPAGPPSPSGGP